MHILSASDSSVIALFDEEPSTQAHHRVLNLFRRLHALQNLGIRNLHPAYASVLVDFDPLRIGHGEMIELLGKLAEPPESNDAGTARRVLIPVCYDAQFGPDLDDVAVCCGLSPEEVIRIHSSADYVVRFLGFSPGFGYLSGLPSRLIVPRLSTPRKIVRAGSVGIAGTQTGVYPVDSPGGWRVIGRTPLRMFDPDSETPTFLQYGDEVHFVPIDLRQFERQLSGGGEP